MIAFWLTDGWHSIVCGWCATCAAVERRAAARCPPSARREGESRPPPPPAGAREPAAGRAHRAPVQFAGAAARRRQRPQLLHDLSDARLGAIALESQGRGFSEKRDETLPVRVEEVVVVRNERIGHFVGAHDAAFEDTGRDAKQTLGRGEHHRSRGGRAVGCCMRRSPDLSPGRSQCGAWAVLTTSSHPSPISQSLRAPRVPPAGRHPSRLRGCVVYCDYGDHHHLRSPLGLGAARAVTRGCSRRGSRSGGTRRRAW